MCTVKILLGFYDQRKVARLHADFGVLGELSASPVIAVVGLRV